VSGIVFITSTEQDLKNLEFQFALGRSSSKILLALDNS